MRNYYKTLQKMKENMDKEIELSKMPVVLKQLSVLKQNLSFNSPTTTSWILLGKKSNIKKAIIAAFGLIIVTYGTTLLALVTAHFEVAASFCKQLSSDSQEYINNANINETFVSQQLLNERPELFLWKHCGMKVYPFDTICDCRLFFYDWDYSNPQWNVDELSEYFNITLLDIIGGIFSRYSG